MFIDVGGYTISEYEYDTLVEDIIMDHDFGFPYDILNEDDVSHSHGEAKLIKYAADIIVSKIYWYNTEEGCDYWDKVYEAIIRIAEKGR